MSILINNKLLQAAEAKLEGSLTPENRTDYLKILVAAQRYVLHGGKDGLLASLKGQQDPIRDCARGAVNIVSRLHTLSQGTMPIRAMVPAGLVLMIQALDFVDRAKIQRIGKEELARATRLYINDITTALGVTPQMLQKMATMTQGVINDPAKMQEVKLRAGLIKDPRAGTPTLPEETMAPPMNRRARRAAARGRK